MNRHRKIITAKIAAVLATIPVLLIAYSGGPPAARTGAPGELTCAAAGCHSSFAPIQNSNQISLELPGVPTYSPGEVQQWAVQVARPGATFYGFQLSVRDSTNAQAGVLTPVSAATQIVSSGDVHYIEHSQPAVSGQFRFQWMAPPSDVGPLTVYVAANAANGNGVPTGDQILLRNFSLQPAVMPGPVPTLRQENPVVNGASFTPGISSGSWVSIFGNDLAPATRIWDPATEIVNGVLPTELDGVSVTINGKTAAIYFISPNQLNVQAPDDSAVGPVQVVVTRDGVASAPAIAQLQREAPAFFLFDQGGRKYPAAVHATREQDQLVFVGPNDLFGGDIRSRRAKEGDTILLFGTGFGPTDPPVLPGQVFNGAARLTDHVTIRFGSIVADDVQFAGLSGAGLYQFNVRVPGGLPEGDVPIVAEIGGLRTQESVSVAVDASVAGGGAGNEAEPEDGVQDDLPPYDDPLYP